MDLAEASAAVQDETAAKAASEAAQDAELSIEETVKQREARYKRQEQQDKFMLITAAALAGGHSLNASPKSVAINAIAIAEETITELKRLGHLD